MSFNRAEHPFHIWRTTEPLARKISGQRGQSASYAYNDIVVVGSYGVNQKGFEPLYSAIFLKGNIVLGAKNLKGQCKRYTPTNSLAHKYFCWSLGKPAATVFTNFETDYKSVSNIGFKHKQVNAEQLRKLMDHSSMNSVRQSVLGHLGLREENIYTDIMSMVVREQTLQALNGKQIDEFVMERDDFYQNESDMGMF